MSTSTQSSFASSDFFARYPMGPSLRKYLGIDDAEYLGEGPEAHEVIDEVKHQFENLFYNFAKNNLQKNPLAQLEIVEELVGMGLPELASKVAQLSDELIQNTDTFPAHFYLGCAAMSVGDLVEAEERFIKAQQLEPLELAPYLNLARIFSSQNNIESAIRWIEVGLDVESNYHHFWEMLAQLYYQKFGKENFIKFLMETGETKNSWVASSLVGELEKETRPELKYELLKKYYASGERDSNFLMEYTGILGDMEKFEEVLAIITQVQMSLKTKTPWQLVMHLFQAYYALGRDEELKTCVTQMMQDKHSAIDDRSKLEQVAQQLHIGGNKDENHSHCH